MAPTVEVEMFGIFTKADHGLRAWKLKLNNDKGYENLNCSLNFSLKICKTLKFSLAILTSQKGIAPMQCS